MLLLLAAPCVSLICLATVAVSLLNAGRRRPVACTQTLSPDWGAFCSQPICRLAMVAMAHMAQHL